MKILFDQGTPLRHYLVGHSVDTAYEQGWSNLLLMRWGPVIIKRLQYKQYEAGFIRCISN